MLIRTEHLRAIRDGGITLAFRRWRRPSARSAGTLLTHLGLLRIESVDVIAEDDITEEDARRAGYASRLELLNELDRRNDGEIYRIVFGRFAPDPRIGLRESLPDEAEVEALLGKLARLDRPSANGPWTRAALELVAAAPGTRAATLASRIAVETAAFKLNVRKLKALGLTISLETGYRLSPRGERVLTALRAGDSAAVSIPKDSVPQHVLELEEPRPVGRPQILREVELPLESVRVLEDDQVAR